MPAGCPWQLKDLHLGKDQGREPFRTRDEIERRIARGGMTADDIERLWECLYLTGGEVKACLEYVRKHATVPFVYPMFVFVALTGARRSELCRSRIDDFDFASRSVSLRERKRDQSKAETIRTVDMHDLLAEAMQEWISHHPGGQFTLCQEDGSPVSIHLASAHFNRTLGGSKTWQTIPGFHTFRHSFASILATRGVDQRVIDAFMGHQTAEMRARYQHLFPASRRRAIDELLT
jgi:integrase